MGRRFGALVAIVAATSMTTVGVRADSAASPLTEEESAELARGETIERPAFTERGGERLVGGVTYTVLEASPRELEGVLDTVSSYETILPYTKSATLLARIDDDFIVTLRQGNAMVDARYSLRIRKDAAAGEVRFWLDRARPHDIADAWGFFRVEPLPEQTKGVPRSLVTYGILVDIGPGLIRSLFESKIRQVVLTVPQRLRRYVATLSESRVAAGALSESRSPAP